MPAGIEPTQPVRVSIGEMKVASPPARLAALGIGSCVAVMIRDRRNGSGGMAHVMLPWLPKKCREGANLFKYADYAIEKMVLEITILGGSIGDLEAKLVGGARMFEGGKGGLSMDIGQRNLEAVRRKLRLMRIPILGEDTGGGYGRSVELALDDGAVIVRSIRQNVRNL